MSSFAARTKSHLAGYKRASLGVSEDGVWSRNGRRYGHILPAHLQELNLLEPYRAAIMKYLTDSGITLHTDFHHLNSSQAMALNLFFPALREDPTRLVRTLTGAPGGVGAWEFEAVPNLEEGTNFDLLIHLVSGQRLYVEVKFTESSFGAAKSDDAHQKKLKNIYRPRLAGKVRPGFLEPAAFLPNYQLMRNISYAEPGHDDVVFVVPRGNASAWAHASNVIDTALLPGITDVHLIALEEVAAGISDSDGPASEAFRRHYTLFREKYLWEPPVE